MTGSLSPPFLSQKTADGNLQLVATPMSAQLGDLIDEYLVQANSFPAFLAGVTLQLKELF